MGIRSESIWARYGVAVLSIALATGLRLLLRPVLGSDYPIATIFLAIVFSAWYGGFGPSLLASFCGALAAIYFMPPAAAVRVGANPLLGAVFYWGMCLAIAVLGGMFRRSRQRVTQQFDEIHHEREQLRATLSSIGDAVLVTDEQGRVTLLNAVAEQLTGWTNTAARGQPLSDVFPIINEHTRAAVESPVERVLREGVIVGLANHTLLIAKDRRERPIDDSAAPIRDHAGKLVGVVLVFRDVNDRRRNEQTMHFLASASEALASVVDLRSTLEKVTQMAVPFFSDWCCVKLLNAEESLTPLAMTHVDPARLPDFCRAFGHTPRSAAHPPGAHPVVQSGMSQLVALIDDAWLESCHSDPEERTHVKQLGLRSYLAAPLVVRGRTVGVMEFLTLESGRSYDSRDVEVAEDLARRTAVAVENADLYQALRDADRKKDDFLALLAHELRNPLAPIQNALQILKLPAVDATTAGEARDVAERQLSQLTRLVDDLLDVSRIMRGKIELRKEPVELTAVVNRAVETIRPLIDSAGHELNVELLSGPVWLEGDLVRLSQALANLLSNAAKYTPSGGRISITATRQAARIAVQVRDTGIGIAPETLPQLFEMFMQVAPGTTRSQGGLGIGLTLVKSLVEMHGGSVEVHSEGIGRGSEFTLLLPCLDHAGSPSAASREQAPASVSGRRLLVVDDNVDAAQSLAMLLRLQGHQVRVAHGGQEALTAVAAEPPELILLDIGMPDMNGYEVARNLRQRFQSDQLTIVALTGWGQEQDRRRSKEAGFDHHLTKPVELATLRSVLAKDSTGSQA